ncbi:SIS domain-containing protein [Brachybacterium sacelli]|uniref:Fructoselysine-6-P-deglycase FrlB-like protein n=1 Tax=Brachybacterium sacelli TaxID=173364 RepID=A0ABS4WYN7_9MICO|nr:sugar isomerase [Brachybacterium sacelli]MBP2381241.1 fructoselysine-6-P-deglycase FrlB-like protein [Brachybacterium sacelli]
MTSATETELRSQPQTWRRALDLLEQVRDLLPRPGERVLAIGCGTSWFMATAYAALREAAGQGVTDAATATEIPTGRDYDRVVALSRSGTTTEIIEVLAATAAPSVLLTAVAGGPAAAHADSEIVLDFADESSVVQTRFATTALALLRASLGDDLGAALTDAETVLATEPDPTWVAADQVTFLGTGWTKALADEAALKLREATRSWSESYFAMEYRHGPIAIAEPGRLVHLFGAAPAGLEAQVTETGATWVSTASDPLAQLVAVHLWALRRAERHGLDPDRPRHLSRAVHLGS